MMSRLAKMQIALEYLSTVYLAESGSIYQWKPDDSLFSLPFMILSVLIFSKLGNLPNFLTAFLNRSTTLFLAANLTSELSGVLIEVILVGPLRIQSVSSTSLLRGGTIGARTLSSRSEPGHASLPRAVDLLIRPRFVDNGVTFDDPCISSGF
jgi:hypothetical protein